MGADQSIKVVSESGSVIYFGIVEGRVSSTFGYEPFLTGFLSGLAVTPQPSPSSEDFSQKHAGKPGVADSHLLESEGMVTALVGGESYPSQCFKRHILTPSQANVSIKCARFLFP